YVPYSYDSLREELGLEREPLDEHGVVSGPVTEQLARRARDVPGTTWGLSTTGIAGPSGGTADRPVGTAFVGLAHAAPWETGASYATVERRQFDGDRAAVRERIARAALGTLLGAVRETGT
ncbi:MAG: CinA family protein, partial [Halobacteriales archaeon]